MRQKPRALEGDRQKACKKQRRRKRKSTILCRSMVLETSCHLWQREKLAKAHEAINTPSLEINESALSANEYAYNQTLGGLTPCPTPIQSTTTTKEGKFMNEISEYRGISAEDVQAIRAIIQSFYGEEIANRFTTSSI